MCKIHERNLVNELKALSMEVSNEVKEEIRKTQSDLKKAIRLHQDWVSRLHEDENNEQIKSKIREAEKDIISIGRAQKRVIDKLRKELELYQQRLKSYNQPVNKESDQQYIASQLKEHPYSKSKNRSISLLKPSVLNELQVKPDKTLRDEKASSNEASDDDTKSTNDGYAGKENGVEDDKSRIGNLYPYPNGANNSRVNFMNALNKVKQSLTPQKCASESGEEGACKTGSDSSTAPPSPSPSPSTTPSPEPTPTPSPPLPDTADAVTQETLMRVLGLVTPRQKEILEKKRNERRKRSTTSTNKNEFVYDTFEPKRKKNSFPYLQTHSAPPQTRSRKHRKRAPSADSGSLGSDHKATDTPDAGAPTQEPVATYEGWVKPAWAASLPEGLVVEPIYGPPQKPKKTCIACGRNEAQSLLVECAGCGCCAHWGCGEAPGGEGPGGGGDGGAGPSCPRCARALPDPIATPPASTPPHAYADKLAERQKLQERNVQLCAELRRLEARANTLKENLIEHGAEKRELLAAQIKTQRQLQTLLDFVGQFKETTVTVRAPSH